MSSNNRNRRRVVGAAFAAALIGLANAPAAQADGDLNPFEDLFGSAGVNSWTPAADAWLISNDPTLAANLDAGVDAYVPTELSPGDYFPNLGETEVFSQLAYSSDPGAFSFDGGVLTPLDSTGELALGTDYLIDAAGLTSTVDPLIWDLNNLPQIGAGLLFSTVFIGEFLLAPLLYDLGITWPVG